MTTDNIYEEMVRITEDYLGPAARRFVARQISSHLGKEPEMVSLDDLPQLIEWTRATISLLTPERRIVEEYTEKLAHLMHTPSQNISGNTQDFRVQ